MPPGAGLTPSGGEGSCRRQRHHLSRLSRRLQELRLLPSLGQGALGICRWPHVPLPSGLWLRTEDSGR